MNKFTRNMKFSLSTERKPRVRRQPWVLPVVLSAVAVALMISSALWITVYCQSKKDTLLTRAARLDAELEIQTKTLDNLRSKKEELCSWANIRRNLVRFNLPLRERRPEQITYLHRFRSGEVHFSSVKSQPVRVAGRTRAYSRHAIR